MPLQNLFPSEVSTAHSAPGNFREQIFAEEWALVEGAVSKRQTEFCGGRVSAHLALEKLGVASVPILSNPDRSPCWPDGIVGSLSHTRDYCCAAVCRSGKVIGLGLDVECFSPLEEKLIKRICTEEEREWLLGQPSHDPGILAKLIFCIKEAAYKCQYPLTHQFIEFHQAQVDVHLSRQSFAVRISGLCTATFPQCQQIKGRFAFTDDHVFSGTTISAGAT